MTIQGAARRASGLFYAASSDPPWKPEDALSGTRGAGRNYRTMSVPEIIEFHRQHLLPVLAPNAYVFIWRLSSMVEEGYQVGRALGLVPKSEVVWDKVTRTGKPWFGMGRHVRASHETAILFVRGAPRPLGHDVRSRFSANVGGHSEKPEFFYRNVVERLCRGPYLELFSRRAREGWTCLGDLK